LESSRCSCSLCSSQGAVRFTERRGHGEVLSRCAGGPDEENRPRPPRMGAWCRSFKTE